MRRYIVIGIMGLLVIVIPSRTSAQSNVYCFPEVPAITNCITGRFLEYWQLNGALFTFGYPLTPVQNEYNADTGQSYPTQWFERNRFELHTENKPPYDVELGRLGDARLRQLGRVWQAEGREDGPQQGCIWFEVTGHNVCDVGYLAQDLPFGFKSVWQGGSIYGPVCGTPQPPCPQVMLAFLGLPLTRATRERNLSGDLVLTQWFERTRLEWHDLPGGYGTVELGLLGSELQGLFGHD